MDPSRQLFLPHLRSPLQWLSLSQSPSFSSQGLELVQHDHIFSWVPSHLILVVVVEVMGDMEVVGIVEVVGVVMVVVVTQTLMPALLRQSNQDFGQFCTGLS